MGSLDGTGFEGMEDILEELKEECPELFGSTKKGADSPKPNFSVSSVAEVQYASDAEEDFFVPEDSLDADCMEEVDNPSIVPDSISTVRVVALLYENRAMVYRFKTDVGDFDMNAAVAVKYGLVKSRVVKATKLLVSNGIFVTSSELASGILVPNVSENDEDCRRLIAALMKC